MDDTHYIIDKYKPLVFPKSEANYCNTNKPVVGFHTSRQILLIHNSLTYTRRYDLEKLHIALIICDTKLNEKNTITIAAYYRQWSLPKDIDANCSQINRYGHMH